MICASVPAVCGTVVAVEDLRGGASSTKPRPSACELGRSLSGRALVGALAPGRAVVGCAVSGQSFEGELEEDEGRFVAAGRSSTGRAVSGQSFELEDEDRFVAAGRAVSGQSFEDELEGEVRVVVSFRGATGFVGTGGGFSAALARAARAAALFGSKRGGSVCFLT